MKIKQQKQIKVFLSEEFGKDRGNDLFDRQEKALNTLYRKHTKQVGKSDENAYADHSSTHSTV